MSRLLTDNQYHIMKVAETGELTRTMTVKALSEQLGVGERTTWRYIKRLLGQGMLSRGPEQGDYQPTEAWYAVRQHEGEGR